MIYVDVVGWESAEILKSIITNYKLIDNQLKSAEVIRPIKLNQFKQETPPI